MLRGNPSFNFQGNARFLNVCVLLCTAICDHAATTAIPASSRLFGSGLEKSGFRRFFSTRVVVCQNERLRLAGDSGVKKTQPKMQERA